MTDRDAASMDLPAWARTMFNAFLVIYFAAWMMFFLAATWLLAMAVATAGDGSLTLRLAVVWAVSAAMVWLSGRWLRKEWTQKPRSAR